MPALFTRTLSLPKLCTAVSTAAFQSSALVTSRWTARGVAQLLCQRGALVVEDVADHHLGALGDQHPGARRPMPLAPAPPVITATLSSTRPMGRDDTRTCSSFRCGSAY